MRWQLTEWPYLQTYVHFQARKTYSYNFFPDEVMSYWMSWLFSNCRIWLHTFLNLPTSTLLFQQWHLQHHVAQFVWFRQLLPALEAWIRGYHCVNEANSTRETVINSKHPQRNLKAHDGVVIKRKLTSENTFDQIGYSEVFVWRSRRGKVSIHRFVSSRERRELWHI